MKQRLPARPDLGHLKKQAKQLLAAYQTQDPGAITRLREALPAAAGSDDAAIAAMGLRLHDAQSCVAREYGFASWADLQGFVAVRRAQADDPQQAIRHWLQCVYAGDIAGDMNRSRPALARRLLEDQPTLARQVAADPWLACAVGDLDVLRAATAQDPTWVHRPGGPLTLPPLVAVAHSSLLRLPAWRERLHACARFLLDAGADVQQSTGSRWPPASPAAPVGDSPLSALYGAAGQNHDPVLTRMLLDAGANPNDGESLYHALEDTTCTRMLLQAGARVTGSNALYRVLDLDALEALQLLLAHGGNANEPGHGPWTSPLLWAIRRRRSPAHIAALLDAGAQAAVQTQDGISAHTLALRYGLPEVAQLIEQAGGGSALPTDEQFIAACARADAAAARQLLAQHPGLLRQLDPTQLRLLPELAAQGCGDAVQLMVQLGWPIATQGGDWQASALNHAVFRGDAALTRFLLAHGAQWTEQHGFGDNACGTLSWASCNAPEPDGDWLGCAQALVAHGMPRATPDPASADTVLIEGQRKRFSDEVSAYLLDSPPSGRH